MNEKPSSELENAPDELKNLVKKKISIMSAINQIKSGLFQQIQNDQNSSIKVEGNMPQSQTSKLLQFLENFESIIDNDDDDEDGDHEDDDDEDDEDNDDENDESDEIPLQRQERADNNNNIVFIHSTNKKQRIKQ